MQVWATRSLLLLIDDEGLNAFHLPSLRLACQAGRTRGAVLLALEESRHVPWISGLCLQV